MFDLSLSQTPHDVDLSLGLFGGTSEAEELRWFCGKVRHPAERAIPEPRWPASLDRFRVFTDQRSTASGENDLGRLVPLLALCRCRAGRVPRSGRTVEAPILLVRIIVFFLNPDAP
jgi:hypothetical protein